MLRELPSTLGLFVQCSAMMVTSCSLIKDDARHRVVSIRPQYALGWSLQSCDVQQCAEDALIRECSQSLLLG